MESKKKKFPLTCVNIFTYQNYHVHKVRKHKDQSQIQISSLKMSPLPSLVFYECKVNCILASWDQNLRNIKNKNKNLTGIFSIPKNSFLRIFLFSAYSINVPIGCVYIQDTFTL